MGKLIEGLRRGTVISTSARDYRNGDEPTKPQAEALKAMGYTLKDESVKAAPVKPEPAKPEPAKAEPEA
jgi:hypothetical protein